VLGAEDLPRVSVLETVLQQFAAASARQQLCVAQAISNECLGFDTRLVVKYLRPWLVNLVKHRRMIEL
jgi:hypothetical protein